LHELHHALISCDIATGGKLIYRSIDEYSLHAPVWNVSDAAECRKNHLNWKTGFLLMTVHDNG
jgi:hypothetical protein